MAVSGASSCGVDYVLDVLASLFLNLFLVYPRELTTNARGQLVYKRTGVAPCVIHTNAYKSPTMLEGLLPNWTHITWVPSNTTRLQRYLLRRMRGENTSRRIFTKSSRRGLPLMREVQPVEVPRPPS